MTDSTKRLKTSVWNKDSVSNMPANEHYPMIDVCKFVFAFLVVIIHISPLYSYKSFFLKEIEFVLQQSICRIADPFYFVAAGFLLFRKIDIVNIGSTESKVIKNYVFKIFRLYGVWSVALLLGGTGQLWFLGGLALAVIIIYALFRWHVSLKIIGIVSLILFSIGVCDVSLGWVFAQYIPNSVCGLYHSLNSTFRLGLIMGVPYVFLGAVFACKHIVLKKSQAIFGCVGSFTLMLVESYILRLYGSPTDYYQLVMLYPFSFFLIYIVTHIKLDSKQIYKRLRIIGMTVFYSHLFAHRIVEMFCSTLSRIGIIGNCFSNSLIQFSLTITITVMAGIAIESLSQNKKFSFLKYLYS